MGVCSGPKSLAIDFPIFGFGSTNPCVVRGRLKSSRVGAAQPLASWRIPLGSLQVVQGCPANPCPTRVRLEAASSPPWPLGPGPARAEHTPKSGAGHGPGLLCGPYKSLQKVAPDAVQKVAPDRTRVRRTTLHDLRRPPNGQGFAGQPRSTAPTYPKKKKGGGRV